MQLPLSRHISEVSFSSQAVGSHSSEQQVLLQEKVEAVIATRNCNNQ